MTLRIGMIGPGGMGQAHIDRINTVIAGGQLVAISDIAPDNEDIDQLDINQFVRPEDSDLPFF